MNWVENSDYSRVLEAVKAIASQTTDISGWAVNAKATRSIQSLMLANNPNVLEVYQDRHVDELGFKVTLYVASSDQSQTGASSASVQVNADVSEQLQQLLNNARLAMNPAYPMAEKPSTNYPTVESFCPDLKGDLQGAHQGLVDRISSHARGLADVNVNSAELYSNLHFHCLQTSTGIFAQKTTTDLYFEVAMERQPGPNLQEVLKYWHFVGLADANIEQRLDAVAQETQLTTQAEMPPAREDAAILVDSYAISKFMAALSSQLKGEAEYAQGPHLKPGDLVTNTTADEASDSLNLTVNPSLKQMAKTTAYTDEGLVAQKADVIIDNTVQCQLLDTRYGHYLQKPVNSIVGNLVVPPGNLSREQLLNEKTEVIEILDFSSLLVNPSSLTWSSEIKLGRVFKQGQPTAIVKGGIVSGNLKASLAGFKFSHECIARNTAGGYFEPAGGYQGPEFMLMWKGISIAGEIDQESK